MAASAGQGLDFMAAAAPAASDAAGIAPADRLPGRVPACGVAGEQRRGGPGGLLVACKLATWAALERRTGKMIRQLRPESEDDSSLQGVQS
jgi:hypothetical protein